MTPSRMLAGGQKDDLNLCNLDGWDTGSPLIGYRRYELATRAATAGISATLELFRANAPCLHAALCRWTILGHPARTKDRFAFATMLTFARGKQWGTTCMPPVFGLDIGATSVGFAVIDRDSDLATRIIHRLAVRIFPEARNPRGIPLIRERRQARLRHRQPRRRRERGHLRGCDIYQVCDTADDPADDADNRKATSARDRIVQVLKREAAACRSHSP